jgi:hypothetical protein
MMHNMMNDPSMPKAALMMKQSCFLFLILSATLLSCNRHLHDDGNPHLIIERLAIIEEIPVANSSENCAMNYSIMGGHHNQRWLDSISYFIFITSSYDTIIACPFGDNTTIRKISIPESLKIIARSIDQIYYHNHDSVFLIFNRGTVLRMRNKGEDLSDIYLLNGTGLILNNYNLDSVPFIYNGTNYPCIDLSPDAIMGNRVSDHKLFLSFYIDYLPEQSRSLVGMLKISTIASIDLVTKNVRMMNIPPPDDLIEGDFKEDGGGFASRVSMLNDSTLLFHFPSSPTVYLYDLKTNIFKKAFTYTGTLFSNDRGITKSNHEALFDIPQYNPELNLYFRKIQVKDYKDYKPFEVVQFFDCEFNDMGYYFRDTTFSAFFFLNFNNHLSVRYKGAESILRVKPKRAKSRSIEYIEQHILQRKPASPFDESLKEKSYEERLVLYLNNFDLPDDSRIVMYSMTAPCSNILTFLMESYRMNHKRFGERNMRYLFYDADIESAMQTIGHFNLENTSYIVTDTNKLFMRYFYPAEYDMNPLVRYRNQKVVEVMTYNPQTIYKKYGELMEKEENVLH